MSHSFNTGQKFILLYLILMVILGLPLTIWSVKKAIEYRSQAEQVTITATVAKTPYNTPDFATNGNQSPIIQAPTTINLRINTPIETELLTTDPDWIRGQTPPNVQFKSNYPLPSDLKIYCTSFGNFTTCSLQGIPTHSNTNQYLTINASDFYQAASSHKIMLTFLPVAN
jgi:hypothetical protein